MAIKLVEEAWSVSLPAPQKLVLVYLCSRANEKTRKCFPSVNTIARETGLSDRGVQKTLITLRAQGLIKIERRWETSSLYTVRSFKDRVNRIHPPGERYSRGGEPQGTLRVNGVHPNRNITVINHAPDPSGAGGAFLTPAEKLAAQEKALADLKAKKESL